MILGSGAAGIVPMGRGGLKGGKRLERFRACGGARVGLGLERWRGVPGRMASLVVYGSLMHPQERGLGPEELDSATAVKVSGFRRSFAQEPSWRRGAGERRGVLTVRPTAGDCFNGILLEGVSREDLEEWDYRERGYHRVEVPLSALGFYGPARPSPGSAFLYVGRDDRYNEALLPNDAYLQRCLAAAASWGEAFELDFRATTFVGARTLER